MSWGIDMERVNIHGVDLITEDDMVALSNSRQGDFEHETFEALRNIADYVKDTKESPWVFVDVGAYTGLYSIYAAKLGFHVEVFEPNVNVFKRLVENVDYNYEMGEGWSGVIRYNRCALSDELGEAYFNHNPNVRLTSGGSITTDVPRNIQRYRVELRKYDGDFPLPDIVKIDVEGHEMNVLRGMEQSLMRAKPWIIVEANTQDQQRQVSDYLESLGFDFIGLFDDRNLIFK